MTIKEQLEHACEYKYRVAITYMPSRGIASWARDYGAVNVAEIRHTSCRVFGDDEDEWWAVSYNEVGRVEIVLDVPKDDVEPSENEPMSAASAKTIIQSAATAGHWVSVLYCNRQASMTGSVGQIKTNSASIGKHNVRVYYTDINEIIVLAVLDQSHCAEPYDIAKERWESDGAMIFQMEDGQVIEHLAARAGGYIVPTDEQMRLMAAAPELADIVRERINASVHHSMYSAGCISQIKFLRSLGVPNVALWYKEDE